MKKIIPLIALFILSTFLACKKNDDVKLPTNMRVAVNNDTTFITTNVTTNSSDVSTLSILYVKGTSTDSKQRVELTITKYTGQIGTYYIDQHGLNGSQGQYFKDGYVTVATGGRIVINSIADGVIKGTFDMYYTQTQIKGSFTAPAK